MEQDRAVRKMMLDIKLENIIPEQCYPFVRERLKLMWLVGYEAQIRSYPQPKKRKPIKIINKQGEEIGRFDCAKEAADFIDVSCNAIYIGASRHHLIKKEYYVYYL